MTICEGFQKIFEFPPGVCNRSPCDNPDLSGGQEVGGVLLSGEGQPTGDKILQYGLLRPKQHLQTAHLDSFLKLGEILQLCELKANSGANNVMYENQQPKQTNNIDNSQEQVNNEERQIDFIADIEQQRQTIKAETRVATGLKEESSQLQENNRIPPVNQYETEKECKNCNVTFELESSLRKHVESCELGSSPKWECSICDERFKFRRMLMSHRKDKHTRQPTFNYPDKMGNHVESSLTKALFKCDQCESKFQLENLLEIHKSARHGDQPPCLPKKTRKRRSDQIRPLPT